jgi:hypothetical protein
MVQGMGQVEQDLRGAVHRAILEVAFFLSPWQLATAFVA